MFLHAIWKKIGNGFPRKDNIEIIQQWNEILDTLKIIMLRNCKVVQSTQTNGEPL
jgi:hypothetical protein